MWQLRLRAWISSSMRCTIALDRREQHLTQMAHVHLREAMAPCSRGCAWLSAAQLAMLVEGLNWKQAIVHDEVVSPRLP